MLVISPCEGGRHHKRCAQKGELGPQAGRGQEAGEAGAEDAESPGAAHAGAAQGTAGAGRRARGLTLAGCRRMCGTQRSAPCSMQLQQQQWAPLGMQVFTALK